MNTLLLWNTELVLGCLCKPLTTHPNVMLYLRCVFTAVLLHVPWLLMSTQSHLMFQILPQILCDSASECLELSYSKVVAKRRGICVHVQGFRLCHRPHSLSNGFLGNSCQEASETPVKPCRRLFTALNPVTFPCEAEPVLGSAIRGRKHVDSGDEGI